MDVQAGGRPHDRRRCAGPPPRGRATARLEGTSRTGANNRCWAYRRTSGQSTPNPHAPDRRRPAPTPESLAAHYRPPLGFSVELEPRSAALWSLVRVKNVSEDVPWLAVKNPGNGFHGGEANRLGATILWNGNIGRDYSHGGSETPHRHLPSSQEHVDVDPDRHLDHIIKSPSETGGLQKCLSHNHHQQSGLRRHRRFQRETARETRRRRMPQAQVRFGWQHSRRGAC